MTSLNAELPQLVAWRVRCLDCRATFTEIYPDGLDGAESYSSIEDPKTCDCESQYELLEEAHDVFE